MVDAIDNGALGNANDEVGALQKIIDTAPSGSTIYFRATELSTYLIYQPLVINKSLTLRGDGANVQLLKEVTGPTIRFVPTEPDSVLVVENLSFVSGSRAIEISASAGINPVSNIKNSRFYNQEDESIYIEAPGINFRIENCYFNSASFGILARSNAAADFFTVKNSFFENHADSCIFVSRSAANTGGIIHFDSVFFSSSQRAVYLRAAKSTAANCSYVNITQSPPETKEIGATYTSSSTNSVSGSGVTSHPLLADLDGNDHPLYLQVSGANTMAGNLPMGGFDITGVDLVDGRDVAADGTAQDSHISDTANPHGTDIENLGAGTLAELNSAITDANLDASTATRVPTAHSASHYSGSTDPLNLQDLGGSSLAVDLVLVTDGAGGWKTVVSQSVGPPPGAPAAHASSHLSGAGDAISAQDLGGSGLAADVVLVSDGLGGWKTVVSQSVGGSGGGASDHGALTGLSDDDHTQYLLRTEFNPFSTSIQDATGSLQDATGSLYESSASFSAHGDNAANPHATDIGSLGGGTLAELNTAVSDATLDDASDPRTPSAHAHLQYQLSESFNSFSGAMLAETGSLRSATGSLYESSASFSAHGDNVANPHATDIENLGGGTLAELNTAVSDATLDDASDPRTPSAHAASHASGASDALSLQDLGGSGLAVDLVLVTDGAGGWKTVVSQSVGESPGAPGAHAASHLSGASDALSAQDLGGSGLAVDLVLVTDGAGGWKTVVSQSVGGSGGGTSDHGALTGLADDDHTQYLLRTEFNPFSTSIQDATGSLQSATGSLQDATGSLYESSASFSAHGDDAVNPHATDIGNLGGGTLSELNAAVTDATLDTSSDPRTPSAHAASHASGASDALSAQDLGGSGLAVDLVLVTDGAGGWKTVVSQSVGGPGVEDHGGLTGLADDDHTQYLLRTEFNPFSTSIQDATGSLYLFSGAILTETGSLRAATGSLFESSASFASHSGLTNNPHATDIENLGAGTLAELNSAITDATLDDSGDPRTPTAHTHLQYQLSESFNSFSGAMLAETGSLRAATGSLFESSASFSSHGDDVANPHATDIGNLGGGTLAELNAAVTDATLDASSASRTPTAHSASHYSGSTDPLDLQDLAGLGLSGDVVLVSDGLGGWKTLATSSMLSGYSLIATVPAIITGANDSVNDTNDGEWRRYNSTASVTIVVNTGSIGTQVAHIAKAAGELNFTGGVNVTLNYGASFITQSYEANVPVVAFWETTSSVVIAGGLDNVEGYGGLGPFLTSALYAGWEATSSISVGTPSSPSEFIAGGGNSYFSGVVLYTEDSASTFLNYSHSNSIGVGTFTFPGTSSNNSIYLASDLQDIDSVDYLTFPGVKALALTGADSGSGLFVSEYWNGTAWTDFAPMTTESDGNYSSYGINLFGRANNEQIRFAQSIVSNWVKNDPPATGTSRYWMRFRISGAVNTVPTFDQIKLHTNRVEINEDGYMEFFGLARVVTKLPWDLGLLEAVLADSPADQDLFLGDNLGIGRAENEFQNGTTDRAGFNAILPGNTCTSCPAIFSWAYTTDDTSLGVVRWVVRWGYSSDGDSVYPTTAAAPTAGANEQEMILISSASAQNVQKSERVNLDIRNIIPYRPSPDVGDVFWVTLERTGGDAADTHTGNIALIQIKGEHVSWALGGHL